MKCKVTLNEKYYLVYYNEKKIIGKITILNGNSEEYTDREENPKLYDAISVKLN